MIPDPLQQTVDRALHAAFGTTSLDDIRPIGGGMRSALACRIVVAGHPYFLRVGGTGLVDPAVELANTRAAADAGLAPCVVYGDAAERVMIAEYVERAPWPAVFATTIARAIAHVHRLPAWPTTIHHLDTLERLLAPVRDLPFGATLGDVLARYAEVAAVYPRHRDVDLAPCHNDLKPQNLLFDGARVWLVDWEAAFINDRYSDLATAANFFVVDDADEEAYLAAYFGAPPTSYQRARFFLARFANHLSYVAYLTLSTARAEIATPPTPAWRDFHDGLISGAIDLADDSAKRQYAQVHLAAARAQLATSRFDAALATVRAG